jgi:CBS domain-containing protein
MHVCDVMTRDVEIIGEADPADLAWERMVELGLPHLVVVDAGRRVTGVILARDLAGPGGKARRAERPVADLMTVSPVTATPQTTLNEAADKMRGRAFGGHLPVVEGSELVGMVTVSALHRHARRQELAAGKTARRKRRTRRRA